MNPTKKFDNAIKAFHFPRKECVYVKTKVCLTRDRQFSSIDSDAANES